MYSKSKTIQPSDISGNVPTKKERRKTGDQDRPRYNVLKEPKDLTTALRKK